MRQLHHRSMRVRAGFRLEVSDGTRTRDRLAMFDGGLIESHRLRDLYEPIEPQLYRYPAIDPDAFRRDLRAVLDKPRA